MKNFLQQLTPYLAVGFSAGFGIGAALAIWAAYSFR